MYRTSRIAVAVLLAFAVHGCAWKKEVEQLKTDNQRLTQEKQKLQEAVSTTGAESAESQATLDEVQKSLEELRVKELQAIRTSIEVVQEGKPRSKRRDQLKAEIDTIKSAIQENLNKLAKLEKEKTESGKKISSLQRLINEMKRSLEEKEATISALEEKALQLSQTVEKQAGEIKEKEGVIQEKEGVIQTQTKEINKAFVAIAPRKTLREKGLVEKKGSVLGMGGGWLRTGKFDPEVFREIDVTTEMEFPITAPAKKIRILSDHPKESYQIETPDPATCKLRILDAAAFWRGSKYLVVMLPD